MSDIFDGVLAGIRVVSLQRGQEMNEFAVWELRPSGEWGLSGASLTTLWLGLAQARVGSDMDRRSCELSLSRSLLNGEQGVLDGIPIPSDPWFVA